MDVDTTSSRWFLDDAKNWLQPLGYQMHSHSASLLSATFIKPSGTSVSNAVIKVEIPLDKHDLKYARCMVIGGNLKMFLSIQSGWFQYRHPDIQKYINAMKHYLRMCEMHPPTTLT